MIDVNLREASGRDLSLMLAWRNHPDVYQGFYTQPRREQPLISWQEHCEWWCDRPTTWRSFIIEDILSSEEGDALGMYTRPVGVLNIGQLEHWSPEIGYYIGNPLDWGKGYATEAVKHAMKFIKELLHRDYCHTTVKVDNIISRKLLENLGFTVLGDAREGEVWYTKKL
uniref:Putative acetyltransferase n=1 Tax=viral metagenome TaxID=1070528 RepID=A0A6M3KUM5_9ZZZZ